MHKQTWIGNLWLSILFNLAHLNVLQHMYQMKSGLSNQVVTGGIFEQIPEFKVY